MPSTPNFPLMLAVVAGKIQREKYPFAVTAILGNNDRRRCPRCQIEQRMGISAHSLPR